MQTEKKLFLLDAMALIYRAYFALNKTPRFTSKGLNTSAIYGFANTLFDVLRTEKPTHIGVAFDTSEPTVRHVEFEEYKAQREALPEDIAASLPYIVELIGAFNIPVLAYPGFEADDIIGTLAKKAEEKNFLVYMMTSDKDFGQLVSPSIFIYKPGKMGSKPEVLGVKEVCERYGINDPRQVIDILGLWGDASDNIPGIPGIGEKRARELISQYGSLEKVLEQAVTIPGKMGQNLVEFSRQGVQSKQLATIILNVPVEFDEEMLRVSRANPETLKDLFDRLEFRAFGKRVFEWLSEEAASVSGQDNSLPPEKETPPINADITNTLHRYILVETEEQCREVSGILSKQASFCFDTETTGLDPNACELVGISFSFQPHEAYFVLMPDNYHEALKFAACFRELFENPAISKTGQNLKFDISVLKWYDIEVKGKLFDTMLAHYLIEPDLRHNMDFLAETYLHYTPVPIESLIGKKGTSQANMRNVDVNKLKEYAGEDADITLQLKNALEPRLVETGTLKLFEEVEVPLIPVLASMEAEGVRIDIGALEDYSRQLQVEINEVETEIYRHAGGEFNIASPRQLGEVLFNSLKITEKPRMTKTRQYATGEDILSRLVNKHPIVQCILDYRSLTKLKSTYVDILPTMANPRTGRIHTTFNQAVVATGRLSSNNPNLQNIPVRTEKGREIRKAFVPRNEHYTLLSADYSQIELRIIAELSRDEGMMEAFRQGLDIHAATAAKVYNVELGQVTKDMRRSAKTINFGIVYGMSAFGLADRLNIPRSEAKSIIDQYFAKYPRIKEYMEASIRQARDKGYVETMLGRRRYIRDITSANSTVRGFAERNAINAPIQGSAADMIKIAMIRIHETFSRSNLRSKMILQVHDELVFDVFSEEVDTVRGLVHEKMTHALPMSIPVVVDSNTGNNWLEAH
jgi:DNA polymerase-1